MGRTLNIVANGASDLVRVIGQITAWSGLALVLLVAFNVLGRYLFSFGTVALQEAEWHMMAVSALCGMSYGLNQGGEVRVDIFYSRMSRRRQSIIDVFATIALCGCALVIAWLSLNFVQQSYSIGEGSPDPGGLPNRYLLKAMLPIAFALLAVQALAMCAEALLRAVGQGPEQKE